MAVSFSNTLEHRSLVDDELDIPEDPTEVFPEVAERNNRVCRNCYRRLRRKAAFPWPAGEDYGSVLAYVDFDAPSGRPGERLGEYYERLKLPQRLESAHTDGGSTLYCTNCGSMDPHRTPSTRSKTEARDAAITLSTTLHEFGVDHDWVHLVERVRELKSQPNTAGDDHHCFTQATADAIDRADR